MFEKDIFNINNKIEICWNEEYYKSNIEDLTEDVISISIPSKDGQYVPLRDGEPVEALYYKDNKTYKFYSVVRGRKVDTIPIILLQMPSEITEVQRRQSVRVQVLDDIVYSKIHGDKSIYEIREILEKNNLFSKATLLDLSADGMKIIVNEEIKLNDILLMGIVVNEQNLYIKGIVRRIEKVSGNNKNLCGIQFVELDKSASEKIVRYIFTIMRSQMKKTVKGD